MIAKVTRGSRMRGLLGYLVGPGVANEHSKPHLVAGDPMVMSYFGNAELAYEDTRMLGLMLDQNHNAHDVNVSGGYVWHVPISLSAREGLQTDELWQQIVEDFMKEMGFDGSDGNAPTSWAAVRHGTSKAGNDHVHLVVNLVREDGTRCDVNYDYKRAAQAARVLEQRYGLEELESARSGRSTVAHKRGELEVAKRAGRTEPARHTLERAVRAAATASRDEAEFVRKLRGQGILTQPRFATGRTDVVIGYSVALKPEHKADRPIWYGGGKLANDLTINRLRGEWPDTAATAGAAVAEWNAAKSYRPPATRDRAVQSFENGRWLRAVEDVRLLREHMRTVPADDRHTWARAARDAAGTLAAWSRKVEGDLPGPLAAASRELSKSAYTVERPVKPRPASMPSASGAAAIMLQAAKGGQGTMAMAVMMRQLMNLAKAIHDNHLVMNEIQRSSQIAAVARGQLAEVQAKLPALPDSLKQRPKPPVFELVKEEPAKAKPVRPTVSKSNDAAAKAKPTPAKSSRPSFSESAAPAPKPNTQSEQPAHLRRSSKPFDPDRGHNVHFK